MTKYLLLLILLVGCATTSQEMSREEIKELMKSTPELLNYMKDRQDIDKKYIHRYGHCESGKSNCVSIECRGLHEGMRCWKTPMTEAEIAEQFPAKATKEEIAQHKVGCQNTEIFISKRRMHCHEYFRAVTGETRETLVSMLKGFCDVNGVSCTLNGKVFGANLTDNRIGKLMQFTFEIPTGKRDAIDTYKYQFVQ